jgi:hypothetical protein
MKNNFLGHFKETEQLISQKHNSIKNQYLITTDKGFIFQSYDSLICFKTFSGQVYLDVHKWNYSATTGKYRNIFLNENIAETKKKINSGQYILCDLNSFYDSNEI